MQSSVLWVRRSAVTSLQRRTLLSHARSASLASSSPLSVGEPSILTQSTVKSPATTCTLTSRTWGSNRSLLLQSPQLRSLSSTTDGDDENDLSAQEDKSPSPFAVIYHGDAYEKAMEGLHGQQLKKALLEGKGKDDEPFDPFLEDEMMEERLMAQQMQEAVGITAGDEDIPEDEEGDDEDLDDEEEETNDELSHEEKYNRDGSLRRTASQLAILRAGTPSGGMFAVIEMAGTQFKVCEDDLLIVNRLKPRNKWSVGSVHTLKGEDEILLIGTTHFSLIGMPRVPGAEVDVMVEEVTKGEKVVIFKKRRRKHSQRKNGFRRDVTMLRILEVRPPAEFQGENYRSRIDTDYRPLPERSFNDEEYDDEEEDDYDEEEEEVTASTKATA
uniref:Large ribosomal subunit protein bL21m n=1 Tax=Entomoneis paludosa TaxID=265537 RepID=A0A7S2YRC8_9STRA|mmetsp:Transcript_6579/g.13746  ORF Transcript_6579/g.13746 Transcript_6579/m.13746 type:complete len:385 (+) Transcript_6579:88-1242(+)